MKQVDGIISLFKTAYDGEPWLDVNLLDTLKDIPHEKAYQKNAPGWNSIWEIVNHMVSWRMNVLQRVQGKVLQTPDHNYFTAITDNSEAAWKTSLKGLEQTQADWIAFLSSFDEADFEKIYPTNNLTYFEHIHGILQHDVYHLGQIVMLAKRM